MGEVEQASKMLGMTPLTLRLFLKEGRFGMAIKGTGSRYIYKVDWEEVDRWISNRQKLSQLITKSEAKS